MNVQDDDNEWLITDDPELNMKDGEITRSVLYDFNNTPSFRRN